VAIARDEPGPGPQTIGRDRVHCLVMPRKRISAYPMTVTIAARVPHSVATALRTEAARKGVEVSTVVREYLSRAEKRGKRRTGPRSAGGGEA